MSHAPPAEEAAPAAHSGAYKWAVVGMLRFICLLNYADRSAINAIGPVLKSEYGFSNEEFGWIVSAFMYVYALSAPFAGPVGDRYSRKIVILVGFFVWSAITGLTAVCSKFSQFVLVRATEGLGETFYFPASMSLVSAYHGKRTRSLALGIHQSSVYAGIILGSVVAAQLADYYGHWQVPFIVLGAAGVALSIVLTVFIREPARGVELATAAREGAVSAGAATGTMSVVEFMGFMLRSPTALALFAIFACANFAAWGPLIWMPMYLKEDYGLSLPQAALIGTLYIQIGSMLGSLFAGVLADRWRAIFSGGRVATQALGLLVAAPTLYVCGTTSDLTTLKIAMAAFGFFKGVYDSNIWASMYDFIPAERRSTVVGFANLVGWFGAGIGPPTIGRLVDKGVMTLGGAFAATAVIYIVIGIAMTGCAVFLAPRDALRMQESAA